MQTSDDTQPRNPLKGQNPSQFSNKPPTKVMYPEHDDDTSGPGCIIWGIVGMFSILLAGVLVISSAFAGWNSGLSGARTNATATILADIQIQCDRMQGDVDAGNSSLLQRRIEELQNKTPAPDCLAIIAPTATQLFIESLPTNTPTPTETAIPTITPSPDATDLVEVTEEVLIESTADTSISSNSLYDLDGLLSEARAQLGEQNYEDAIETLDAIIAIDENFQRSTVESLYFNALTSEATLLFRTGKLAEGIVITGRAEAYGDVQGLNYERFIAQLYLDGQRLKITNPAQSVRAFSRIAYEQGLTNYLNGQVMAELQEAFANYGNSLSDQGDYCGARDQYNAALDLQPIATNILRGDVTAKRDSAGQACTGAVPVQLTPAETVNPDGTIVTAQPLPTSPPQPTIVPVGQSG